MDDYPWLTYEDYAKARTLLRLLAEGHNLAALPQLAAIVDKAGLSEDLLVTDPLARLAVLAAEGAWGSVGLMGERLAYELYYRMPDSETMRAKSWEGYIDPDVRPGEESDAWMMR